MKFSDYMSLKEDSFNNVPSKSNFDNSSNKSNINPKELDNNKSDGGWNEDVKNNLKEACEYILYVAECGCFGIDKIDRPEGDGLDQAVKAFNQFASSGDGKNFSKPNIDDSMDFDVDDDDDFEDIDESADISSIVEAASYILNLLEGDDHDYDDDICLVGDDGVDKNTIITNNLEKDQFSTSVEVDKDIFDNSTGWDDWD